MNRENAPSPSSPGSCDEIILSSPLTRESFPLKTIAWLLVDACKWTKNEGRRDRNMEGRIDDERNWWPRISPVQSFTCFTFFCDSVLLESSRVWLTARASRPGGGVWGVWGDKDCSAFTPPRCCRHYCEQLHPAGCFRASSIIFLWRLPSVSS